MRLPFNLVDQLMNLALYQVRHACDGYTPKEVRTIHQRARALELSARRLRAKVRKSSAGKEKN
jgi:hypothetical protein